LWDATKDELTGVKDCGRTRPTLYKSAEIRRPSEYYTETGKAYQQLAPLSSPHVTFDWRKMQTTEHSTLQAIDRNDWCPRVNQSDDSAAWFRRSLYQKQQLARVWTEPMLVPPSRTATLV